MAQSKEQKKQKKTQHLFIAHNLKYLLMRVFICWVIVQN